MSGDVSIVVLVCECVSVCVCVFVWYNVCEMCVWMFHVWMCDYVVCVRGVAYVLKLTIKLKTITHRAKEKLKCSNGND